MSDSVFSLVFFIPAALLVAFIVYNSCFKRSPRDSKQSKKVSAARQAEMAAFVEDFLARFPAEFAAAELRAKGRDDDLLRCYTREARKGFLGARDQNNRDLPIGFPHFSAEAGQKNLELMLKRLTTLDSNLESDEILDQARQAAAAA